MTKSIHKIAAIAVTVLFAFLLSIGGDMGGKARAAFADTPIYTSVLTDLEKDENFKLEDYPEDEKDNGLYIKQIAESTAGELLIYVYQPAVNVRKLTATNISMALSEKLSNGDTSYNPSGNEYEEETGGFGAWVGGGHGGGGSRPGGGLPERSVETQMDTAESLQIYDLHLLSSQGVFSKYRVGGLILSKDTKRFYNISALYRDFDYAIDDEADNDNTINKVACKVGQLWTVTTTADGVQYEVKEIEVVKLTSQMVGVHRYADGFQWDGTKSLDSHFIAFTCDHKIDKLLSADIEFDTRSYEALAGSGTTYGDLVHHRVSLYGYQVASNDGSGWFGKKEEWHRMTSVKEFAKEVNLTDDEINTLSAYDWVLNFYESEFKNEAGGKDVLISALIPGGFIWTAFNACTTTGELVFDVSLLRLEFKYGGKIYNLGVVSNIQTGSNKPINGGTSDGGFNFWQWLADLFGVDLTTAQIIFWCVVAVIALAITLPILSAIFPVVGQVLKAILNGLLMLLKYLAIGLWWLITSPFRLIALIVRKIKGGD